MIYAFRFVGLSTQYSISEYAILSLGYNLSFIRHNVIMACKIKFTPLFYTSKRYTESR